MDIWVRQLWKPACSGNMLLILDIHEEKQVPSLTCLTAATQHQCTYLLEQPFCSFKKCGIVAAMDGLEDFEIHIAGIDDYVIEDEEDKESTDKDPFAGIEIEDMPSDTDN